jgi:hypothetical protein
LQESDFDQPADFVFTSPARIVPHPVLIGRDSVLLENETGVPPMIGSVKADMHDNIAASLSRSGGLNIQLCGSLNLKLGFDLNAINRKLHFERT